MIKTRRLIIRPMQPDDMPALHQCLNVREVAEAMEHVPHPLSLEDCQKLIDAKQAQNAAIYVMELENEHEVSGFISITPDGDKSHLSYALHPDHAQRGLMSEALAALLDDFWTRAPNGRLYAEIYQDNPRSARLLEQLGFVRMREGHSPSLGRGEPCVPHWEYEKGEYEKDGGVKKGSECNSG